MTITNLSFMHVSTQFTSKVESTTLKYCVDLLKRCCIRIVLYAKETVYPDKVSVKRFDKLVDTAVHKIFKNFHEHVTCDIRIFVTNLRI